MNESREIEIDIFEGLRDGRITRKDALRRLLYLDCFDVLHFLDLAWLHHVINSNAEQELRRKTEFAFDLHSLSMAEAELFRDWVEGSIEPGKVPTELLQKFMGISNQALRVWLDDARVQNVLECVAAEEKQSPWASSENKPTAT